MRGTNWNRLWVGLTMALMVQIAGTGLTLAGWNQQAKIAPPGMPGGEFSGKSAAIHGFFAIVGSPGEDTPPHTGNGVVRVYRRVGTRWSPYPALTASDIGSTDYFGIAVSISGNYAIVGAEGNGDAGPNTGAAYILKYDEDQDIWTETAKLLAPNFAANEYFGHSVGISGDYAIVGAHQSSPERAIVYKRDPGLETWSVDAQLYGTGGVIEGFGVAVGISGERAIVGAPGWDYRDPVEPANDLWDCGKIFLFERQPNGTWAKSSLLGSGMAQDRALGLSVAIDEQLAGAGASEEHGDPGAPKGSVYVFSRGVPGPWTELTRLWAPDGAPGDAFGFSLGIDHRRVIVGAPGDDDLGAISGSAYVFSVYDGGWIQEGKIHARDGTIADQFGDGAVDISGDYAIVGAYDDDELNDATGAAFVFKNDGGPSHGPGEIWNYFPSDDMDDPDYYNKNPWDPDRGP